MKTTTALIPHFEKSVGRKVVYYPNQNARPSFGKLEQVSYDEPNNTLFLTIDIGKKKTLNEPLDWLETKASDNNTEIFKYRSWYLVIINAPLGIEMEI